MKTILAFFLFAVVLLAQPSQPPVGCSSLTNTATSGQALTAAQTGRKTGPCTWAAGGGGGSNGGAVFVNATGCGSNTCVATPSPAVTSYTNLVVNMKVDAPNTGDTTLNLNGVGAAHIHYGGSVLTANGLNSTAFVYTLVYDGTYWNCTNCGNGIAWTYLNPVSQDLLAVSPFSIAKANYAVSNPVEGTNAGKISTGVSAWTYGTTPLVHNATEDTAMALDFMVPLPPSWPPAAGIPLQITWNLPLGSSGVTGNLQLYARGAAVCNGNAPGNFSAPVQFTASPTGAATVWTFIPMLTVTTGNILTGAAPNCWELLQIFRDATNTVGSGDTLSDPSASPTTDAQFIALMIGTPGGAGGTQGATGATGASGTNGTNGTNGSTSRSIGYPFAGSDLVTGHFSKVYTMESTCTLSSWSLANQNAAGAAATDSQTVKVLKHAGAIPTIGDSINTSGVSISSAPYVRSTILTDFTTTTFTLGDVVSFDLSSYGGVAQTVSVELGFTGCS